MTSELSEHLRESVERIALAVDLSRQFVLVLVVGPGPAARRVLSLVAERLPQGSVVSWQRLDLPDGDLDGLVRPAAGPGRQVILAHGLEALTPRERAAVEHRLNLSRDALAASQAALVLWIPDDEALSFREQAADLFAWRSLWIEISPRDVPEARDEEVLRRVAAHGLERWQALALPLPLSRSLSLDAIYVEPEVAFGSGGATAPFCSWAEATRHGLLIGGPGSGKSVALRAWASRLARSLLVGEASHRVPVLVEARELPVEAPPAGGLERLVAGESARAISEAARAGRAALLVDALDEVPPERRRDTVRWLRGLARAHPRLSILAASRPQEVRPPPGWTVAELEPWDASRIEDFTRKIAPFLGDPERGQRPWRFRDLLALVTATPELSAAVSNPLSLTALTASFARTGALVAAPVALWERLFELRLGDWELRKGLSRGEILSRTDVARTLARVALLLVRAGRDSFELHDVDQLALGLGGPRARDAVARELLDTIIERSGLVEPRGAGYAFRDRHARDVLAALALHESESVETLLRQLRILVAADADRERRAHGENMPVDHRREQLSVVVMALARELTSVTDPAGELRRWLRTLPREMVRSGRAAPLLEAGRLAGLDDRSLAAALAAAVQE